MCVSGGVKNFSDWKRREVTPIFRPQKTRRGVLMRATFEQRVTFVSSLRRDVLPTGACAVLEGRRVTTNGGSVVASRELGLTFFRSGARGLHLPGGLPPEPAKQEARKRRANERPRVACCEELGGRYTTEYLRLSR